VIVPEWEIELQKEKSLWDIVKICRSEAAPPFNNRVRMFGYPFVFISAIFIVNCAGSANDVLSSLTNLSSALTALNATILGFLITGLAVFTTLSDKNLLIELAKTKKVGSSLSVFKYIYFNLLSIFAYYIAFLIITIFTNWISVIRLPISNLELDGIIFRLSILINSIIISSLWVIIADSFLRLKSFIWSVYQTFLSMLLVSSFLESMDEE
jgi:hypothetical protein